MSTDNFNPLFEIKRASRAMKLREMDPEESAQMLERILREALIATSSGSRLFQKNALRQLKDLQRDMIHGQINAGSNHSRIVGAYSHAIDQLEEINAKYEKESRGISGTIDSITKNMPTADTFIAALMTANPLVGYGVKVFRDISQSRKEIKAQRIAEERERKKLLEEEVKVIDQMLKNEEDRAEAANDQKEVLQGQKREYTKGGIYRPVLLSMREDLHKIHEALDIQNKDDFELQDAINDQTYQLGEIIQLQTEQQAELAKDQMDQAVRLERDRRREDELKELRGKGTSTKIQKAESTVINNQGRTGGGFLVNLFGGAMGARALAVGGILGGIMSSLMGVFNFLYGIGSMAIRLVGRSFAPLALVTSIIDFVDGFLNAEEILGWKDVNIAERILAGFGNIGNTILDMIGGILNFIGEMTGVEFLENVNFRKFITEDIPNWVIEKVTDLIQSALDIGSAIKNIASTVKDRTMEIIDEIVSEVFGIFHRIKDAFLNPGQTIKGIFSGAVDQASSILDNFVFNRKDEQTVKELEKEAARVDRAVESANANYTRQTLQRLEQNAINSVLMPTYVNAPNTTNTNVNNNNIFGGGSNTNNPNQRFRTVGDMNYRGR